MDEIVSIRGELYHKKCLTETQSDSSGTTPVPDSDLEVDDICASCGAVLALEGDEESDVEGVELDDDLEDKPNK